MNKIKLLFLMIIILPASVCAENILSGVLSWRLSTSSLTNIENRYQIDGKEVVCLDATSWNPDFVNYKNTYKYDSADDFGKGLIAISNYAKKNGLIGTNLADVYRIYTANVSPQSGQLPISIESIASKKNSLSGNMKGALEIGLCAAGQIECSNLSSYLPGVKDEDSAKEISISKLSQNKESQNGKNIVMSAEVSLDAPEGTEITGCSAKGFSCSVSNVTESSFTVTISGTISNKTSVDVLINFKGVDANQNGLQTSVEIYGCSGGVSSCQETSKFESHKYRYAPYQRFIVVNGNYDASFDDEHKITINLPSICDSTDLSMEEMLNAGCCDSIDPSNLIEDSDEEAKYIDACGPIVVIENNCGADSCNDSSYKDYTHSYVRQKTMKSIMKALDNGQSGSVSKYLDRTVNTYCGVYTSEKVDTLMPATAVSVSGQFFVFDKYNDLNCTTETSCLRQPYISGKIKATFFTDYKRWKTDYESAKSAENSAFSTWQNAVEGIGRAYQNYLDAVGDYNDTVNFLTPCPHTKKICSYDLYGMPIDCKKVVDQESCNTAINDAKEVMAKAERDWRDSYEVTEPNAQQAYKSAVNRRMNLQAQKDQCVAEDAAFRNNFNYDFSPQLEFLYYQTSHTSGTKEYKMDMISNTSSVKYWPNTTTTSMSNTDYLGDNAVNLNKDTAQNPNIQNYTSNISRGGVYVLPGEAGKKGATGTYTFPDNSHDSCSGSTCTRYDYNNKSFTSIKTVSNDATDPYGKITNKDEISMIYFYRPDKNTFALMNSGEFKTLNYDSNESITQMNGLEVGYVYNLELTAYKGQYSTNFKMSNVGYKGSNGGGYTQELINKKINEEGLESFESTCNYCNYEMAFKRECPECDPNDPNDEFKAQFYYRSISLSDVNPSEKKTGETNWSDDKGRAAENAIEATSGKQIIGNIDDNSYLAIADGDILNKQNVKELDYTYLADSSGYDIYDDESKEFLEYEITLTPKDMQIIKKNSAKSNFDYSKMNMCGVSIPTTIDIDNDYCFKCTKDMKECESSFVTAFFSNETDLNNTRTKKWKYYVNGVFCKGSINSCLGGSYPDPVFTKSYLAENKNWP